MKEEKPSYPILPLGEDWRIRRYDSMNIVLEHHEITEPVEQLSQPGGREVWRIEGYYSDLPTAVDAAIKKRLEPGALEDLQAQIEGLRAEVAQMAVGVSL